MIRTLEDFYPGRCGDGIVIGVLLAEVYMRDRSYLQGGLLNTSGVMISLHVLKMAFLMCSSEQLQVYQKLLNVLGV